jgi:hypothetical protein
MVSFEDLGQSVESRWRALQYREEAFPEIACDELARFRHHERFTLDGLCDWLASATSLPSQRDLQTGFGEPPIVVFENPRFFVQLLIWVNSTTAIHQHRFVGAFSVLAGSSVQTRYEFDLHRRVDSHLLSGPIRLREVDILAPGSICSIEPALIHSVFHLDVPSVTAVVRTYGGKDTIQYGYRPPSIVSDPDYVEPLLTRQMQLGDSLLQAGKGAAEYFRKLAAAVDVHGALTILNFLRARSHSMYSDFLSTARRRHGEIVDDFDAAVSEDHRKFQCMELRRVLVEPRHRFFLAMATCVPSRRLAMRLIAQRFPGDPVDTLLGWLSELSGTGTLGIELDDGNRALLTRLLDGIRGDALVADLASEYGNDVIRQRDAIRRQCELLQHHPLLGALLNE